MTGFPINIPSSALVDRTGKITREWRPLYEASFASQADPEGELAGKTPPADARARARRRSLPILRGPSAAPAMAAAGMQPVPFISVDNERGAFLAAQHLAAGLKAPTQAAIIEGIRTADNAQQRSIRRQRDNQNRGNLECHYVTGLRCH